jgi:hypothetical protein
MQEILAGRLEVLDLNPWAESHWDARDDELAAAALARCTGLKALDLGERSMLHWFLDALGKMTGLTALSMRNCIAWDWAPALGVVRSLTALTYLDLSGNDFVGDSEGPSDVESGSELSFSVSDAGTSDGGDSDEEETMAQHSRRMRFEAWDAQQVRQSERREKLQLLRELEAGALAELQGLERLTSLDLGNVEAGSKSWDKLAEAMTALTALAVLEIGCCSVSRALCVGLGRLSALTHLDAGSCSGSESSDNAMAALVESAVGLTALTSLDLGGGTLCSDDDALAFATGLSRLTALRWLRVWDNQLCEAAGEAITGAALELPALGTLYIDGSGASPPAVRRLRSAGIRVRRLVRGEPESEEEDGEGDEADATSEEEAEDEDEDEEGGDRVEREGEDDGSEDDDEEAGREGGEGGGGEDQSMAVDEGRSDAGDSGEEEGLLGELEGLAEDKRIPVKALRDMYRHVVSSRCAAMWPQGLEEEEEEAAAAEEEKK